MLGYPIICPPNNTYKLEQKKLERDIQYWNKHLDINFNLILILMSQNIILELNCATVPIEIYHIYWRYGPEFLEFHYLYYFFLKTI